MVDHLFSGEAIGTGKKGSIEISGQVSDVSIFNILNLTGKKGTITSSFEHINSFITTSLGKKGSAFSLSTYSEISNPLSALIEGKKGGVSSSGTISEFSREILASLSGKKGVVTNQGTFSEASITGDVATTGKKGSVNGEVIHLHLVQGDLSGKKGSASCEVIHLYTVQALFLGKKGGVDSEGFSRFGCVVNITGKKGDVLASSSPAVPIFRPRVRGLGKKGTVSASGQFGFSEGTTLTALFRTPYPDRLEVLIQGLNGPLISDTLGLFNPMRDLTIYAGGHKVSITGFAWDPDNSRYILYLIEDISQWASRIQVIHHVPNPPFHSWELSLLVSLVMNGKKGSVVASGEAESNPVLFFSPGSDPDIAGDGL